MAPTASPVELDEPGVDDAVVPDRPWLVIVWNDPINLMSYVTFVLQKLFGYSREKATKLMLDVHHKGRAVVSSGTRERAEIDVFRLHEHGLWATMQQDAWVDVERRIERAADGSFVIRIDAEERELLRTLPGQLRALLQETPDDPSLRRLFPPAYAPDSMDNLTFESEYRRFMGQDLHDRRVAALTVLEETVDASDVTEEQLTAWMTALNDVRLVLGTRLDVTEDLDAADLPPDDPRMPGLALYGYLSWLLEQIVEALAGEA